MVCIYVSPSVGKSLDGSDSIKTTGNYVSLSPPAAEMEASPKFQLLVFLSSLYSLSLRDPSLLNVIVITFICLLERKGCN